MTVFDDQIKNTKDAGLRRRIRMASIIAAVQIQGEAIAGITPATYTKRQALANKVITTSGLGTPTDDLASMFVWAVCQNAAINPSVPDSDIQFTINSTWNDCAGVTGND